MEMLLEFVSIVVFIIFCVVVAMGSYAAMVEKDAIRKGMREGKNDYYGNKIEEEDE